MPTGFNELDLLALSELAWEIVDPEGDHEAQEQIWTLALPEDRPPIGTAQELRTRLNEIADAISWPPPAVHPRALVALMVFLAEHPQRRRIEEGMLVDALDDAYPDGLPTDMTAWLAERQQTPGAHRRTHGARQPRRHSDTRPPLPEDTSTA
jgi:hypothetical protein